VLELHTLLEKNGERGEVMAECTRFIKESVDDSDLLRLWSLYRNHPQIQSTLMSFLSDALSTSNCCSLYQRAVETGAQSVMPVIARFVRDNFTEVTIGEEFASMEPDICKRLAMEAALL